MKQIKLQINRLSAVQIAIFLLILGLFLGILCANVFRTNFTERLQVYEDNVFTEIANNDIDYAGLFRYVLGNNFSDFIMYWLLCITILGVPFIAFKITSYGFFAGFFISAVTMKYGMKGIILIMVYVFPHGILYLPITLISLYKGYSLCRTIYQSNHTSISGIVKPLKDNLIVLVLLAIGLIFASFLEAYPGAYFLKKVLGLFT